MSLRSETLLEIHFIVGGFVKADIRLLVTNVNPTMHPVSERPSILVTNSPASHMNEDTAPLLPPWW